MQNRLWQTHWQCCIPMLFSQDAIAQGAGNDQSQPHTLESLETKKLLVQAFRTSVEAKKLHTVYHHLYVLFISICITTLSFFHPETNTDR